MAAEVNSTDRGMLVYGLIRPGHSPRLLPMRDDQWVASWEGIIEMIENGTVPDATLELLWKATNRARSRSVAGRVDVALRGYPRWRRAVGT